MKDMEKSEYWQEIQELYQEYISGDYNTTYVAENLSRNIMKIAINYGDEWTKEERYFLRKIASRLNTEVENYEREIIRWELGERSKPPSIEKLKAKLKETFDVIIPFPNNKLNGKLIDPPKTMKNTE